MRTDEVMRALAIRYAPPTWAFLPQVRSTTGYAREVRTADALAMALWPSRGLELHGFEVKCSRADWARELAQPAKAEEIAQFCDRWWVVVGDEKIVQPGELPPTWGLIVPRGEKLVVRTDAAKLNAAPLDRYQLAAILRRVHETCVPLDSLEDKLAAKWDEGRSAGEGTLADYKDRLDTLTAEVKRFEDASGVRIQNQWDHGKIGDAVKYVLTRGPGMVHADMQGLKRAAQRIIDTIDKEIAELD